MMSQHKNELKTVKLTFSEILHPFKLICKKSMALILAKWFANSIFELLMLNIIMCPIFRLISQLQVLKNILRDHSLKRIFRLVLLLGLDVNVGFFELNFTN